MGRHTSSSIIVVFVGICLIITVPILLLALYEGQLLFACNVGLSVMCLVAATWKAKVYDGNWHLVGKVLMFAGFSCEWTCGLSTRQSIYGVLALTIVASHNIGSAQKNTKDLWVWIVLYVFLQLASFMGIPTYYIELAFPHLINLQGIDGVLNFGLALFSSTLPVVTVVVYLRNQLVHQWELLERETKSGGEIRARAEFMAFLCHELRNPLNGSFGTAQLLATDPNLTPEQLESVESILETNKLMKVLLNDVLDFAKLEAGKLIKEEINVCLGDTLRRTVRAFRSHVAPEVSVECHITDRLPRVVLGDPSRFNQIVWNVMSNASKFTKKGSIVVRLDVVAHDDLDDVPVPVVDDMGLAAIRVRLSVKDTGIGIAKEVLNTLFEPFSQAKLSVSRQYGGTGLGLSIVQRLAELMGGRATIHSDGEGLGAEVQVELMFVLPQVNAEEDSPDRMGDATSSEAPDVCYCPAHVKFGTGSQEEGTCHGGMSPTASHSVCDAATTNTPAEGGASGDCIASSSSVVPLSPSGGGKRETEGSTTATAASHNNGSRPPLRILVVDDAPLNRKIMARMLEQRGHVVPRSAEAVWRIIDGVEAVEAVLGGGWFTGGEVTLSESVEPGNCSEIGVGAAALTSTVIQGGGGGDHNILPFDLVLMDIEMPRMRGIEATRIIRSAGVTVPIVAVSGNTGPEQIGECIQAGMNAILSKPIELVELISMVEKLTTSNCSTSAGESTLAKL